MKSFLFSLFFTLIGWQLIEASDLKVATYNIWNPVFEEKYRGQNTWDSRLPRLIENIIASKADILLLQEVSADCYQDLITHETLHKSYNSFYFSHFPSQVGQKEGRDGLAIFIN